MAFSLKTFLRFIGPGYMVAIGYFDPGNWATDLSAGSQFNYSLLFIILASNLMACILQYLCVKIGLVTNLDLAQASRKFLPSWINILLYILCETAIIACDLAEVIGTAIALQLLFGLPIVFGVALTGLDVLVILMGWNSKYFREFEYAIIATVLIVSSCFIILLVQSAPEWSQVLIGFIPSVTLLADRDALYISMGIVGATVMPHNLYLHSHLVKYRSALQESDLIPSPEITVAPSAPHFVETFDDLDQGELAADSPPSETLALIEKHYTAEHIAQLEESILYSNYDCIVALTFALFVNSSILIVAAAIFYKDGKNPVADLTNAHDIIKRNLGSFAATAFAIALLLSGQSSTITGTMAGQIVMDGFLGKLIRVPAWARRLLTRLLAIGPAILFALFDQDINDLLVLSQVILSIQLPFAVWPLVLFTCSSSIMTVPYSNDGVITEKSFKNGKFLMIASFFIATTLTLLNAWLVYALIFQ